MHWLVPTPGFVYALVFVVCGAMLWKRTREARFPPGHALNLWLLGGVLGLVGGRLCYLLVSGGLVALPVRSWFGTGGIASWGAYIGAALATGLYSVFAGLRPWPWIDLAASIAPLFEVIGRWGCWLAGDDIGRVSKLPWAIRFPAGSDAWNAQVARGSLSPDAGWSLPVHPEQFYLMASAAVVFVVISAVWRRTRDRPGITLAACLVLYGFSRYWLEFFRDPAAGGAVTGLSPSQWMCATCVAAGAALFAARRHARAEDRAGR